MKEQKIRAMFIFEIMGRPANHIVEGMELFLNKLAEVQGIKIASRKIHEPKLVENGDGLFTTFAEIEVVVDKLDLLFLIMFNMFPSHVEIIEPEELSLNNFELTSIMAELALKLHRYEQVTKGLTGEREILIKRLKEVDPGFFKKMDVQSIEEETKENTKKAKKSKKKH